MIKKSLKFVAGFLSAIGLILALLKLDTKSLGRGCPDDGSSACTGCGYCDRYKR